MTSAELKAEITNDPQGLGLSPGGVWLGDQAIADLLNAVSYRADVPELASSDVIGTVYFAAYDTLSIDEQEWVRWITSRERMVVSEAVKTALTGRAAASDGTAGAGSDAASIWSAAERGTIAPVLLAMVEVDASRAEVLWGVGLSVTAGQVAAAANV